MVLDWPQSFGSIREDLVPEVLLQQMRREAGTVAQCPNFWTAEVRHALHDVLARHQRLCFVPPMNVVLRRAGCGIQPAHAQHLRLPLLAFMLPPNLPFPAPALVQSGGCKCAGPSLAAIARSLAAHHGGIS